MIWGGKPTIFGNTHILQTLFFREAPELCSYLQVIDDLQISLQVAPETWSFQICCVKVSMKVQESTPKWEWMGENIDLDLYKLGAFTIFSLNVIAGNWWYSDYKLVVRIFGRFWLITPSHIICHCTPSTQQWGLMVWSSIIWPLSIKSSMWDTYLAPFFIVDGVFMNPSRLEKDAGWISIGTRQHITNI